MLWVSGACFEKNMIHPQVLFIHFAPRVRFLAGINRHTTMYVGGGERDIVDHTRWAGVPSILGNQESRIRRRAKQSRPHLRSCSLGQCFLDARELDLIELEMSLAIASKRKSAAKWAMCPSALRACATNETIRAPGVGHHLGQALGGPIMTKSCQSMLCFLKCVVPG